jgi:hypothetical protein
MVPPDDVLRFTFNQDLIDQVTDYDVIMAYEVLMRRLPENSGVIKLKQRLRMDEMLMSFFTSDEFREGIIGKLRKTNPSELSGVPARRQLDWLTSCFSFNPLVRAGLYEAGNWGIFFRRLLAAGGLLIPGPGLELANPAQRSDPDVAVMLQQVIDLVTDIKRLVAPAS